jgi:hypothetical protein
VSEERKDVMIEGEHAGYRDVGGSHDPRKAHSLQIGGTDSPRGPSDALQLSQSA